MQVTDPNYDIELFDYPTSFYGAVVRLCLVEKGILNWKKRTVDIGIRMENYEPWYFEINSRGVVPTFKHGEDYITDCFRIIHYIDQTFPGPSLHFDEVHVNRQLDDWLLKLYSFPMRELFYSRKIPGIYGTIFEIFKKISFCVRRTFLRYNATSNPELARAYSIRLEDVNEWQNVISSPSESLRLEERMQQLINELEEDLIDKNTGKTKEFLIKNHYSLIDVLWTVFLARLTCIKLDRMWKDGKHPHVNNYYKAMKSRASFRQADIWDSLDKRVLCSLFLKSLFPIILKYLLLLVLFIVACKYIYDGSKKYLIV